jgi:hypothetical protein
VNARLPRRISMLRTVAMMVPAVSDDDVSDKNDDDDGTCGQPTSTQS